MTFKKLFLIIATVLPLIFIFSVIIHEYGHVLGGKLVGVNDLKVFIYPGYEIYPNLGQEYFKEWREGAIAITEFQPTSVSDTTLTNFQNSIIALMGSGLNLILSYISMLLVYKFKPKGFILLIGVCGILLGYDILFYSIFPTLLNLPHLIFWGGNYSEPISALSGLGIHKSISLSAIILLALSQVMFLCKLYTTRIKSNNNKCLGGIA